jgi:hypothetical protein
MNIKEFYGEAKNSCAAGIISAIRPDELAPVRMPPDTQSPSNGGISVSSVEPLWGRVLNPPYAWIFMIEPGAPDQYPLVCALMSVEQIPGPQPLEAVQLRLPPALNVPGIIAALDGLDDLARAHHPHRPVDLKLRRVKPA